MSLYDKLRERVEISAETWRPDLTDKNHADTLIGTIIETSTMDTDYGPAPSFIVEDEDGNYWRWVAIGEVAQKRVRSLDLRRGDGVGVKYLGKVPSPNRKEKDGSPVMYTDWNIVSERAEAQSVQQALPIDQSNEPF